MNTQHTPGPWHVANDVQIRSERHQIAKVWMMRNGEGNANAKLIAHAPTMLHALQDIVRVYGPESGPGGVAYAAITKATGGPT